MKKYKLGVNYNVFNGKELLRQSVENMGECGRKAKDKYGILQKERRGVKEEGILKQGYVEVEDDFGLLKDWNSK